MLANTPDIHVFSLAAVAAHTTDYDTSFGVFWAIVFDEMTDHSDRK